MDTMNPYPDGTIFFEAFRALLWLTQSGDLKSEPAHRSGVETLVGLGWAEMVSPDLCRLTPEGQELTLVWSTITTVEALVAALKTKTPADQGALP